MIHTALEFLTSELNSHLKNKNGSTDDKVVLTNVATQEGGWAIPSQSLGLSLINIEEERILKEQRSRFVNEDGETEHYNPEIKINLYVLVTANYTGVTIPDNDSSEYLEGLKQLSHVLGFFQKKSVFTSANSPALDTSIGKLVVELFSYSFEQLYNFWSVIGTRYLPSILYKVRLITVQEKGVLGKQPVFSDVDFNGL